MVKKLAEKATQSPRKVSAAMPISDVTNEDIRKKRNIPEKKLRGREQQSNKDPIVLSRVSESLQSSDC